MAIKQKIKCADEYDCISKYWRSVIKLPWSKIKRRLNKRFRKEGKQEVRWEVNESEQD